MNFPENLKYSKDHEWVLRENGTGLIGITDFAQSELGDIVFIDLDPNQADVKKGDIIGTIEAVKTVSDMFAPFSGKIKEVNPILTDNPEIINSDPYGKGWLIKMEINNPGELDELLDHSAYKKLTGQ